MIVLNLELDNLFGFEDFKINFLKFNTQLFFTTHNLEILTMDLPLHCFTFLKKDKKN